MAQPGLQTPTGRWCQHLTGEWSKTAAACNDAGSRVKLRAPRHEFGQHVLPLSLHSTCSQHDLV